MHSPFRHGGLDVAFARSRLSSLILAATYWGFAGCADQPRGGDEDGRPDAPGLPLIQLTDSEHQSFDEGDHLFELPMREADGLGPLYIRNACNACHRADGRGPGVVTKILDQAGAGLPYGNTERPYMAAGATRAVVHTADDASVALRVRFPPAVFGRGYLEAVEDSEIERAATSAQARVGSARGRINRVTYVSESNPDSRFHHYVKDQPMLIGRFGLKGRVATLDDFTAEAFAGDMGMTSLMRPKELPNPENLLDDARPGADLSLDEVNSVANYVRVLAIPPRRSQTATGRKLFEQVGCTTCHVPAMHTRADYPIAAIANKDAEIYTDLLLHDMGEALADGIAEGLAGPRDWKTAPLIGLRFMDRYLHDGRAASILDAVLAHGAPDSEARDATAAFISLPLVQQEQLLAFVKGL